MILFTKMVCSFYLITIRIEMCAKLAYSLFHENGSLSYLP